MSGLINPGDYDAENDPFGFFKKPDDDEKEERGLAPREGAEVDSHSGIVARHADAFHDQLAEYAYKPERVTRPQGYLKEGEDFIEGEFTLKEDGIANIGDGRSLAEPEDDWHTLMGAARSEMGMVEPERLQLSPDELELFRQELSRAKSATAKAVKALGRYIAYAKRLDGKYNVMNSQDTDFVENTLAELRAATADVQDFINHVREHWGYLGPIVERLPHGMDLGDLDALPGSIERRVQDQTNTIDLLGVRQHLDMLTLTIRAIDRVLPKRATDRLLTDDEVSNAVRGVAGGMELTVPGVKGGTVDVFEYDIVRDGLEAVENAARMLQNRWKHGERDVYESTRNRETLAAAVGAVIPGEGFSTDGREFQQALAHIAGGLSQELWLETLTVQSDVQRAAYAATSENPDSSEQWAEAAGKVLEYLKNLKRQMRPRLQFLEKRMVPVQAVTLATRIGDLGDAMAAPFGNAFNSLLSRFRS